MWEGIMQEWKGELGSWISCPAPASAGESALLSVLPKPVKAVWDFFTYDSVTSGDDEEFCPFHWATPLHELNCEIVWPPALDKPPYKNAFGPSIVDVSGKHSHDHSHLSLEAEMGLVDAQGTFVAGPRAGDGHDYVELDTPEYAGKIFKSKLIEKLLAQGGIRLAAVLNRMFADVGDDVKMV
jgi:hypothetical protein